MSQARDRAEVLRRLHTQPDLLVLVNVWDVASAIAVAAVPGCRAVATASAAAVDLPTTADLEFGYGDVDTTIRRAVQLGVAGANLEDALRPLPSAIRMVEQAVDAAAAEGVPLVLNARTDRYLQPQGQLPAALLEDALQRGQAFLDAGADCVFVPGCTNPEAIATLVDRFGPGRLSLLAVPGLLPPEQLRRLGVARLSHGPAPHRHALAALTDLAAGLQATTIHT